MLVSPYKTRATRTEKRKQKVCGGCKQRYMPGPEDPPFKNWCDYECGVKIARERQTKALRKRRQEEDRAWKERKATVKSRSQWMKEAQAAFNSYIRARDIGKPCISSGRMMNDSDLLTGSRMDAGHYRSTGAAPHLRFNTWNCHGQSVHDNRDKSGNVVEYRIRLIDRIGLTRVEALERDNTVRQFDIEYLKRVKKIFTKRAKHIKKLRGYE